MPSGPERHSLIDRIMGAALMLLVASLVVYVAAKLLLAVWVELVVIALACGLVAALVTVWRGRGRGW